MNLIDGQVIASFYGTLVSTSLTFTSITLTGNAIQAGSSTSHCYLTVSNCTFDRIRGRACYACTKNLTITATTFNKCVLPPSEDTIFNGGAVFVYVFSYLARVNIGGSNYGTE